MKSKPLSASLGAEVTDFNIATAVSDEDIAGIVGLLYEHAVVCIRGQQIEPAQLAQFATRLGKPVLHNEENLRMSGVAEVMSLSNADDRDERQLNGGAHWHTDLVYTEEPASFTMLHAVAVPPSGGGTLFANQLAAYEALSAEMKAEIAEMEIIHCYEGRTDGSMPEVIYPLVRAHPVTARKMLYGAADTGIGIVGMEPEAARKRYAELGVYATQEAFVYRHQYRLNDVVIWDNAQLLHAAEVLQRAATQNQQRIMHRVSVRGWPRL